jgi:transposase InsO family protein
MRVHANAKLGPAGRLALVCLIGEGASLRSAAKASGVSVATAHRWSRRWSSASAEARASGAWAADRSSRPRRCPRQLEPAEQERICRARQRTNLGPGRLAGLLGRARSTIYKVLARHGLSRRARAPRQSFKRYEWSQPGALLHMDVKRLARFDRPGHWAHDGQRSEQIRNRGAGWSYLHVVIDDHSRYLYVEQHAREDAETNARTLERALAHFAELGLPAPQAVMTDNAKVYGSHRFQGVLAAAGARHITPPPYTPRWNGKAERVIRTLQDEWAYAHAWPTSQHRTQALRSFVRYYNRRRPHSSLGDRPPISRVHNLRGQDS